MLRLIQSNQMEVLSEQLSKMLAIPLDNANLLANEHVLVQSPGMSTWLRLEVAKYNGIAAALSFPLPSSFTWQLCHELLPDVPKDNAFTKAAMTWKLMDLLPTLLTDEDFAPLKAYLTPELTTDFTGTNLNLDPSAVEAAQTHTPTKDSLSILSAQHQQHFDAMKLYQLCGRIADIFDQYLVYRPSWILGWEQNEHPIKLEQNQLWQPKLWRALIDYNQNTIKGSHYHRANLHQELISALQNPQTVIGSLPERLFVFGISSMPPQTLEVLYHLAERIEVIMFSLSPCQHYWGDIVDPKARARMALQYADKKQLGELWEEKLEVGNPILANNGKMGRELLDLMLELPAEHTDFSYDCYIEPEQSPDELNLLQGLQFDILQMETLGQALGPDAHFYQNAEARRSLKPTDDSITLRSCHSPLREVETLHDHLLELLSNKDNSDSLLPKDIVVMMPDVAAYAPYIDAVFGTSNSQSSSLQGALKGTRQSNYYIPYAIADRGAAQESPLINSFLNLLNINQSRFGLTDIISILEVPAILRKFQLDDDGLQLIRRWLDDANVRWGRDEHTRLQQGVPGFKQNSWAFGISRLIQGYAFNDDSSIYHETLLVKGVEGQSAQTLGYLLNFLESIDEYQLQLATTCPTLERIEQLYQLLDVFFEADDDEREQVQTIREALTALKEELEGAGHHGELDIEVLKQWFNQRLNESRVGQRYLAGSVNFCTLMPMRSIPFKVVCLLGMNDGVYPRVQHPVGFDLMAHNGAIKGDRSRRLDDRYLFLEALLSARQQLYISYIGHSERDNAERIPSMLVSELIEYYQLCYFADYCFTEGSDSTLRSNISNDAADQAIIEHLIVQQPLQPFDAKLFQSEISDSPLQQSRLQQTSFQQSYSHQWCPPKFNDPLTAQWQSAFIDSAKPIAVDLQSDLADAATEHQLTLELSALLRFFRSPAQFFLNRSLKVDFNLRIQADDNDEPFGLDSLERYKLQSALLDSAISNQLEHADIEFVAKLKASGSLPMKPFDDLLLNQYQKDIAPLIGRVLYLTAETQTTEVDVDLSFNDIKLTPQQTIEVNLIGRIDDIYAKGQVNYRPGTAHGRDFLRVYLRHLCLNAAGVEKNSYLLDIGHFHAFTAIKTDAAQQLLQLFIQAYVNGQAQPLCFMPRTALAYVEAEGEHDEKLHEAQSQWIDEQTEFGEGNDPHNKRLFSFPEDFTEQGFGHTAMQLLKPMLSVYHKGTLADLDEYINETVSTSTEGNQ
ncbi:exodeoxyribonuclease V subunit gamma [Shewanella sp. KT0246]|uniref:exodeoxyribonuclease V subunit gamma n=1 Tax=Shewanella sp. KT0246 TaxID=2815912 RepID=UPI001BB92DBD|nr:exodeoxyribonuclease V subunit gamma [Shewanella sp. KT0246]GIU53481.1 RecBCD enzyme subunit RecC [Shewanella sp. KT0246]